RPGALTAGAAELPPPLRADPHPGFLRALLHGFYDALWYLAAALLSPWLAWRSGRDPAFRAMVRQRAGWDPPDAKSGRGATVLVYGVSVGEVKGAVPLVRAIEERYPGLEVAISSTTD